MFASDLLVATKNIYNYTYNQWEEYKVSLPDIIGLKILLKCTIAILFMENFYQSKYK